MTILDKLNTDTNEIASLGDRWLIMKRGLYYRPNAMGYTGIREQAGIYTEQEARQRMDVAGGVSIIQFADGPEVTDACFDDIARDYWQARATTAEAELSRVREALSAMTRRFELYAGPNDVHAGHHDLELLRAARLALSPVKDVRATDALEGGK